MTDSRPIYQIDGHNFFTLEDFYNVVDHRLCLDAYWGHNLDAFNDILRGGFGTPKEGFVFRWLNSGVSRIRLGYPETVRQLEIRLSHCHPDNRELAATELNNAKNGIGPTVFDWLVEIIKDHGDGGTQAKDRVTLELL